MTATVTALGAVAGLFVLLLCIGLAAAARGDLALSRALAGERERRLREAQPGRRLQRVA
jgi:hypothetical protein